MRCITMKRYWGLISILFACLFILVGCTGDDGNENDNNQLEETEENELENNNDNNSKGLDEDLDETNDQEENSKDIAAVADEDHYITGKVFIMEDENMIRVEAETNL